MMKYEFEALAGYEVSKDDYYKIIEPMYMATNLSKAEFVKCIDKKRFALPTKKQMINAMRKEARHLCEICGFWTDYESKSRLEKLAHEYLERFYHVNWGSDLNAYAYFLNEYEFPSIKRGCTYPKTLVLGYGTTEYERITLIK